MRVINYPRIILRRSLTCTVFCLVLSGFVIVPCGHTNAAGDAHMKTGLQLSLQKKWAQAEAEYRKAIALDPKNALYQSYLADALATQGKFGQAQDSYKQSEKTEKSYPQPGTTKIKTEKSTNGQSGSGGNRQTSTGTTSSQTSSSGTYKGGGLPPAVFVLPDGSKVTITDRTGTSHSSRGNLPEVPQDIVGANDVINDPRYLKGQEYAEDEKWPQAATEFLAVLKIFPRATEAWDALGDVYFHQAKWQDAEKAHRGALRLEPNESYFHAQVAYDLLKQGRGEEALKAARTAKQLGLEDHQVFDELGLTGTGR